MILTLGFIPTIKWDHDHGQLVYLDWFLLLVNL